MEKGGYDLTTITVLSCGDIMKKIITCVLVIITMAYLLPGTMATNIIPNYATERLQYYGIIKGSDKGLELDRNPTRLEALCVVVRLMGNEITNSRSTHPFSDVPEWGENCVAFGYNTGIINGISDHEFGSCMPITSAQFVTIVLRALGYDDDYGVFFYNSPWEISNYIGLTNDVNETKRFTRADMAQIAYSALSKCVNGYNITLFSFSDKYGQIVPKEKRAEGIKEFGLSSTSSLQIGPVPLSQGGYLQSGSHVSYFAGETITTKIGESIGIKFSCQSGNCDIVSTKMGINERLSIDKKYYYRDMTITPCKPGKTFILAKSENGALQVLHVEVLKSKPD